MTEKVVVVDDTDHVRAMLVHMLELDGFEVVGQAGSGPEAVEVTAKTQPDVVVMDHHMPLMDGLTAATRIRADRPSQAIILYSAYLDAEVEERARQAGVAVCLGKVEGLGELELQIKSLCRDFKSR